MKNRLSLLKYQSHIYNVERNYDVNHTGIKMWCNKKLIPSLNFVDGKSYPYGSKGIIRHYHYWLDPKLDPGIVLIRIIPCSFHAFATVLSLS